MGQLIEHCGGATGARGGWSYRLNLRAAKRERQKVLPGVRAVGVIARFWGARAITFVTDSSPVWFVRHCEGGARVERPSATSTDVIARVSARIDVLGQHEAVVIALFDTTPPAHGIVTMTRLAADVLRVAEHRRSDLSDTEMALARAVLVGDAGTPAAVKERTTILSVLNRFTSSDGTHFEFS